MLGRATYRETSKTLTLAPKDLTVKGHWFRSQVAGHDCSLESTHNKIQMNKLFSYNVMQYTSQQKSYLLCYHCNANIP